MRLLSITVRLCIGAPDNSVKRAQFPCRFLQAFQPSAKRTVATGRLGPAPARYATAWLIAAHAR